MDIALTPINGVFVVETSKHIDHRGSFFRAYCRNEMGAIIGDRQIVQINISRTRKAGAIRGMHYQSSPHGEMKLIRCLKGRVWDVAVDLRADSSTYLKWHAVELSGENARMMVIPEGCAHGFQVIEADSELLYLHTGFYAPEAEKGIAYNDPSISIAWPIPVTELSKRDSQHVFIRPQGDNP